MRVVFVMLLLARSISCYAMLAVMLSRVRAKAFPYAVGGADQDVQQSSTTLRDHSEVLFAERSQTLAGPSDGNVWPHCWRHSH